MLIITKQTWPEGQMPTPEQLRDWYARCRPAEQLETMRRAIIAMEAANRCITEGHDHLKGDFANLAGYAAQLQVAARRYRTAWRSARRRARRRSA